MFFYSHNIGVCVLTFYYTSQDLETQFEKQKVKLTLNFEDLYNKKKKEECAHAKCIRV